MKNFMQKVFSLFKRLFLFLKLHVHIEAKVGSNSENKDNAKSTKVESACPEHENKDGNN